MMKIIIILKQKSSIILFFLLILSCNNTNKSIIAKRYYYAQFNDLGDNIPYVYAAHIIFDNNDKRVIKRYLYNVNNKKTSVTTDYYILKSDNLFLCYDMQDTVGHCFLSIRKDTCVIWKHPDENMNIIAQIEQCYIGEETVRIGTNNKNIQAYKFLATVGSEKSYERPLNYYIYYDKSFIFIKDENIYTGTSYRKRIDSIPLEFGILLDSIAKVENEIK